VTSVSGFAAAVCGVAALVFPSLAAAGSSPKPRDPCARAGRDSCGTTGIGFYRRYRYGLRWFGDYRHAVRGVAHGFCLDLGYWYAARSYRYRLLTGVLRSRAGKVVPRERRQELAYAVWRHGQSSSPDRQAAVMLYVHSRMGDARPSELDPHALNSTVVALYRQIVRDARRYHGPYRIQIRLPARLTIGEPAAASIRVLSARGFPLPRLRIRVSGRGAGGLPAKLETNAAGVARLSVTPTTTGGLQLRLTSQPLAAAQPRVFVPTAGAAAANGQRLAVPAAETVDATLTRSDVHARPELATQVERQLVLPGARIADSVSIRGLGDADATVQVELFGPFASRSSIRCGGRPVWRGSILVHGDGTATTPPLRLTRPGFYAYREHLLATALITAVTTPCPLTAETTLVAPRIVTGRGDSAAYTAAPAVGRDTPTRLRIPALQIDAAVVPSAIDTARGVLGIPADIHEIGWWRDGSAPGESHGTILLAGHRDSARAGTGALFLLDHARPGQLARLTTTGGHARTYRITSVRRYPKSALPLSVYSSRGGPRLVLVTCGGPFDTGTGHYRDNIVATALPSP
jgi:hypothetical protein